MGFLDDFNIDLDDVKTSSFEVDDGFYSFVISGGRVQNGTTNDPNVVKFVIDYNLFDDEDLAVGQKGEWFTIAERDADGEAVVTDKAKKSLSFLKNRLIDLGFKGANLNEIDADEFDGITGTLQLATKDGWQNVRNVKVSKQIVEEMEAAVGKVPSARKAPASTASKGNPFAKTAK